MGMLATVTNLLVALPCTLLLLTSFLPFFITKGLVALFRNFSLSDGRNPSEKSNPGTSDRSGTMLPNLALRGPRTEVARNRRPTPNY